MEETKNTPVPAPAGTPPASDNTHEQASDDIRRAHEAELARVRIDGEVRYQLALMGARNPVLAARVLDLSTVKADGENVSGVTELVRGLMASDPYLFAASPLSHGGESSSGAVHGEPVTDPDTLSDGDYYAMKLRKQ